MGLLRLIVKISYHGTDSLTGLKFEAEMIYQSLKGLVSFGGQAQIIFHLKPCMLRGIVFYQLDDFPLGQVTFYNVNPDILDPQLEHKAGIRGISSFKPGNLGLSPFPEFCGCHLKATAKAFFKQILLCPQIVFYI